MTAGHRPDEVLDGAVAAHARLLAHLRTLTDDAAREPSQLPGWSVGHVVTHLARNADSFTWLMHEAAAGVTALQYPGGAAQRDGDIEAGSGRQAAELVADLAASCAALEAAWAAASDDAWEHGRALAGVAQQDIPIAELPFRRWREVEVHHADLGLAEFGYDDWDRGYVRRDLDRMLMLWRSSRPMGLTGLPPQANALTPACRLAWLLGRIRVDGLGETHLMP